MNKCRTDCFLKRTCRRLESRGCVAGGCLRRRGCRCWGSGLGALLRGFLFFHPWKLVGQGCATRQRGRALLVLRRRCRLCPELEAIRGSSLLAPRSRLVACAGTQTRDGVLERRWNCCRVLDWWSLKWLQDSGERRQALCKGRLAVDEPNLPLKFKIHRFALARRASSDTNVRKK